MKIEMFTVCDYAEEISGKLVVVGTFDTIFSSRFPCMHHQLSVVIRVRFDLWEFARHPFRIEIRDLEGKMCMDPLVGAIDVVGAGNATAVSHLLFSISNLRFTRPGVINFVIYMDDKELGSIPLYLRKG